MHGAGDLNLARISHLAEHFAPLGDGLDAPHHVLLGHRSDEVRVGGTPVFGFGRIRDGTDGGLDVFQHAGEQAQLDVVASTLDRAAMRMTHDDDELRAGDAA